MSLRHVAPALVGFALFAGQDLPAQDASALHGRWESARTSRGGIGQTLQFTSAGQLISTTGVLINGTYHTDGLRLFRRAVGDTNEVMVQFTVRGDTLLQWGAPAADSQRMYRTAASTSRAGMVGEWFYTHSAGGTALQAYMSDGRWRFRLPIRSDTSTYQVRSDTIFAEGAVAGRYRWSLRNDTLGLQPLDQVGAAATYVRATER